MRITEILNKEYVLSNLKARDKRGVIEELSEFLFTKEKIKDKDRLVNAILDREKLGSTGIGDNVAIPHTKLKELKEILAVFGRSKEGIEFDSLDGRPVHFVCLLVAPEDSVSAHLKALAKISRLLKSDSFRTTLLNAEDEDNIYQIILNEDLRIEKENNMGGR
ncbi:MAG: PTS sugar transporter subunit IIA [Nitrospinae bacterium]|nr:PTS sugar transporter subunit IIA [Nitrospinota bacterium]